MNAKLKWLTALVAVLVVANIALVAFIWLHKDIAEKPGRPRDARDYLVKTLEMNEEEVKAFDSLRKVHFEKINLYKKELNFLREQLFRLISKNKNDEQKNMVMTSLLEKTGELQESIDKEIYTHFSQLRSILNAEQQQKFDSIIQDVLRMIGPVVPPPNDPPNNSMGPSDQDHNDPPESGPPH